MVTTLDDAIAAETGTRKGPDCSVGTLLGRIAPDEANRLRELLSRRKSDWSDAALGRVIRTAYPDSAIGDSTIGRHRRNGGCTCGRRGLA